MIMDNGGIRDLRPAIPSETLKVYVNKVDINIVVNLPHLQMKKKTPVTVLNCHE